MKIGSPLGDNSIDCDDEGNAFCWRAHDLERAHKLFRPQICSVCFTRFKRKARHFLLEHQENLTLQKLRRDKPLTPTDLQQLGDMLIQAGVGDQKQIDQAAEASHGLVRFIRSLVGLGRAVVAEAFSEFVAGTAATAD